MAFAPAFAGDQASPSSPASKGEAAERPTPSAVPKWQAPLEKHLGADNYLAAAELLKPLAWELKDPAVVRRYTTLLVDRHTKQLAWRVFFVKNMLPGERLEDLRNMSKAIVARESEMPVEDRLGELLVKAAETFPDHPQIQFAKAYFYYYGKGFLVKPVFTVSADDISAAFQRAFETGYDTAESTLELGITRYGKNEKPESIEPLFARVLALDPDHPRGLDAMMNLQLASGRNAQALKTARHLFEIAANPEQRVNSLSGAARASFKMGRYEDTMTSVNHALKLMPGHNFVWIIGMDCLRSMERQVEYNAHIQSYLDLDPRSPSLFQTYLEYLLVQKITKMDQVFIDGYAQKRPDEPLARVTWGINVASYYLLLGKGSKALEYLRQAEEAGKTITNPPPMMSKVLEGMIKNAISLEEGSAPKSGGRK